MSKVSQLHPSALARVLVVIAAQLRAVGVGVELEDVVVVLVMLVAEVVLVVVDVGVCGVVELESRVAV